MSTRRRVITTVVTTLALGGLVATPGAFAAGRHAHIVTGPGAEVGQIAYIANGGTVRLQRIGQSGAIGASTRIGPLNKPAKGRTVSVSDLVASGDGQWVAWEEVVLTKSTVRFVIVQHAVVGGKNYRLTSNFTPVGFAKDEIVATDQTHNKTLHLSPSPHLVAFADNEPALAAIPEGVVDSTYTPIPHTHKRTEQLRLTLFGGSHVVLHSYTLGETNYRDIDGAWVSSDARRIVIERGNHQDFDGLGPSSLADEFTLSGSNPRTPLGHFGTDAAQWRIADVTFRGSGDTVWAIWERGGQHGPQTLAASRSNGTWHRFQPEGGQVAVAGATSGYLVVQPGKLVRSHHGEDFTPVATGPALLLHGTVRVPIGVRGPEIVWLTMPQVPAQSQS